MKPSSRNVSKRDRAVALLAAGYGPVAVAKMVGVTRATIGRWAKGDDFAAELRRVRRSAAQDLAAGTRDLLLAGLDAARAILGDPAHPGHVAVTLATLKMLAPPGGGGTTVNVGVDARTAAAPDLRRLSFSQLKVLRDLRLQLEAPMPAAMLVEADAEADADTAAEAGVVEEESGPGPAEEEEPVMNLRSEP